MQRVLLLVLCFMYFQPLDAVFGFLDVIFGDSFKRPRPVKCNADFTDCHYLKDGTEGVIYIGNKLTARRGRQGANEIHFHLPEEKYLSGVPGNQHYAHPQKFQDLGRRNRLSNLKYPALSEESVILEAFEPERASVEDY
ncbi:uncharacterized protein LOC121738050 isoform X1 [Aricia agestis]|uniref:uncharacterized protein LOC121738050 isoform X1 n=1 Tax=Aricia agestis TaxID=91739 RepID=UPI001C204B45|nr:uncharacterized protein LOC121738050 isoform X1 [Aricia agestis]